MFLQLKNIVEEIPLTGLKASRMSKEDAESFIYRIKTVLDDQGIHDSEVHVGGSYRRGKSSVGDLDIALDSSLVNKSFYQKLIQQFRDGGFDVRTERPHPKDPDRSIRIPMGEEQLSLVLDGRTVEFKKVKPGLLGAMLIHITGSYEFNVGMRQYAIAKNMGFSQAGLKDKTTGQLLAGETEESVFKALGVKSVPPEQREKWPYPIKSYSIYPQKSMEIPPEILSKLPADVKQQLKNFGHLPQKDPNGVPIPADFLWSKNSRQSFYKRRGRFNIPDTLKLDRYV